MNKKAVKSNFSLLLAAAIWGLAFVAQSDGMNYVGPFAFTASRCFLGAFALVPVCIFTLGSFSKKHSDDEVRNAVKRSVLLGVVCGTVLFGATVTQQIGIQYTSAGKSGFITALYIVLVPVFGKIIFKNRTSANTWISVIMAAAGLYLLCVKNDFSVERGDMWVVACAFLFAFQIIIIDRYACNTDSTLVSLVQFFVVAVFAFFCVFIFKEKTSVQQLKGAWLPIAYTGIFSSGVAYTLQIVGQKNSENPTVAALLMSLESVFAAISGRIILHETFSLRELCGVILMLFAVVLSQIPFGKFKKEEKISK